MSISIKTDAWHVKDANGEYRDTAIFSTTLPQEADQLIADTRQSMDDIAADINTSLAEFDAEKQSIAATIAGLETYGTDPELATTGMPADAKAAGDKIGELKSAIDALNGIVISPYDYSSITTDNLNISPSTGKWVASNNYYAYYLQIPENVKVLVVKGNATNGTNIALLTASDTHTHGDIPVYATGWERTHINAGIQETYSIPSDAKYVWFIKESNGVDFEPEFFGFNVNLDDVNAIPALLVQVEGNTNIISETTGSNKNLWDADDTIEVYESRSIQLPTPLPAGTYTLSAFVTSTDTDANSCRASINGTSSNIVDLSRDVRSSGTFTTTTPLVSIKFYSGRNTSTSAGDTSTWANIQLEVGSSASSYMPHAITAIDSVARGMVNRITKFVSPSGDDTNDGNTINTTYATIGKAISETPDIIYVKKGIYTESGFVENQNYRYGGVRIICDDATLIPQTNGLYFRNTNLYISGLTIDVSNASASGTYGIYTQDCTGTLKNCKVIGATGAGGFRLDGSKLTLINCVAANCAIDGFNAHTVTDGYEADCTLIDCIAHDCGDDGLSFHEHNKMHVISGEYYNNIQAGIAPHQWCEFDIEGSYCHDNGHGGIEALNPSYTEGSTKAEGKIFGCVSTRNGGAGVKVGNYVVAAFNNSLTNNTLGTYLQDSGCELTIFTPSTQ